MSRFVYLLTNLPLNTITNKTDAALLLLLLLMMMMMMTMMTNTSFCSLHLHSLNS